MLQDEQAARRVADEHDRAAVPAVGDHAGGQGEDEVGQETDRTQEADADRGAVDVEDEPGEGKLGDLRAEDTEALPAPEGEEIPVVPERIRWRGRLAAARLPSAPCPLPA